MFTLHMFNFILCKYYIAQIYTHMYMYFYVCIFLNMDSERGGWGTTDKRLWHPFSLPVHDLSD